MDGLTTEQQKQHRNDTLVIRAVKNNIPKKVFRRLNKEIYESEYYTNFRILHEPIGEYQGKEREVWVDQYVGPLGDDYHGTVCFELPDKTFLAWDYSM